MTVVICPQCRERIDLSTTEGASVQLGATGQFPFGKSDPADEGELRLALATDFAQGVIRVDFGKPVAWVAIPPTAATAFALELLKRAQAIERRRT